MRKVIGVLVAIIAGSPWIQSCDEVREGQGPDGGRLDASIPVEATTDDSSSESGLKEGDGSGLASDGAGSADGPGSGSDAEVSSDSVGDAANGAEDDAGPADSALADGTSPDGAGGLDGGAGLVITPEGGTVCATGEGCYLSTS